MLTDQITIRRAVLAFIVGLFVLVAGLNIYHILTTGKVVLQTDDPQNYVSITPVVGALRDNVGAHQGTHSLEVRLKPGVYEISAFNKAYSATKIISVKARQTLKYRLNPGAAAASPEPVYGESVSDLAADGSGLVFLDASHHLARIDSSNTLMRLQPDRVLYGANWANASLGIARDADNNLYVISGDTVSPLELPFLVNRASRISYTILKDGSIYVSNSGALYAGHQGGNFKRIYTGGDTIVSLNPGQNGVAAIVSNKGDQDSAGNVLVVNSAGQTRRVESDSNLALWSPDGAYLLAKGEGGVMLLDSTLKKIVVLPASNTDIFTWANNATLLYSQGGDLWSYNVKSQQSNKLAVMPGHGLITGLYLGQDGAYAYIVAQKEATTGATSQNQLFRLSLNGQSFDSSLSALSVFMPETVDYCGLNYINFTQPTILVSFSASLQQQNCQVMTEHELGIYGLDTGKFKIELFPQPDD